MTALEYMNYCVLTNSILFTAFKAVELIVSPLLFTNLYQLTKLLIKINENGQKLVGNEISVTIWHMIFFPIPSLLFWATTQNCQWHSIQNAVPIVENSLSLHLISLFILCLIKYVTMMLIETYNSNNHCMCLNKSGHE